MTTTIGARRDFALVPRCGACACDPAAMAYKTTATIILLESMEVLPLFHDNLSFILAKENPQFAKLATISFREISSSGVISSALEHSPRPYPLLGPQMA